MSVSPDALSLYLSRSFLRACGLIWTYRSCLKPFERLANTVLFDERGESLGSSWSAFMPEKMKLERERRRRMASCIGTCSKAASRFAVCMKAMASDEVTISIENSAPRCRNSVRIMALKRRGSRRRSSWGTSLWANTDRAAPIMLA